MLGKTISHYTITEKLGEGGMGVVYRAHDLKLKRDVAIKFLPKRLSTHGEERERFVHEAQAASALNHPGICTIHEIDEADGETFIVMEMIEGVTLREWIHDKIGAGEGYRKLPVKEVTALAVQIGEALGKAHERGIVHRDIKSENIMVTPDVRVKIMDFGLAKLQGVTKLTKTGSTIGTMAYMSPEQVEGAETDHRTDIFSFGVLLYEMLTGKFPFRAAHEAAIMYEIVNSDPVPITGERPGLEQELVRIISKALEKNREERYQSVREMVVDLKRFRRDTDGRIRPGGGLGTQAVSGSGQSEGHGDGKRRDPISWMPVTGVAVIVLLAVAGYLLFRTSGTRVAGEKTVNRITSGPGLEMEPSISPDGQLVAYATDDRGNLDIMIQPVGGGQPVRLVDHDADDADPAFSPEGDRLAFVSARNRGGHLTIGLGLGPLQNFQSGKYGDLFVIPVAGGEARKLADNAYNPAWSPDGKEIAFRSSMKGNWDLWAVDVESGDTRQLTRDEDFNFQPAYSPDGKWLVYPTMLSSSNYVLRSMPVAGGEPRVITSGTSMIIRPIWSDDGEEIIYSTNRGGSINLWKFRYSPDGNGSGDSFHPTQITVGGGADVEASAARSARILAYATTAVNTDIWEMEYPAATKRRITSETSVEDFPQEYPDGRSLLVTSNRSGLLALYRTGLDGQSFERVTPLSDFDEPMGRISPDGEKLVYLARSENRYSMRMLNTRTGRDTELVSDDEPLVAPVWSPDGKSIAYDRNTNQKADVFIHDVATGAERQLTRMEYSSSFSTWSPDGKYLTFQMQQPTVRTIWIVPARGGTPRQVTSGTAEHSHPQWSPVDSDLILFVLDHKNLCAVRPSSGKIEQLTSYTESDLVLDYPSWSHDGRKIYYSITRKTGDIYTLENY